MRIWSFSTVFCEVFYYVLYRRKSVTHLGNRQGSVEVLLCPEEAEEGVCLSWPEMVVPASGEHKSSKQ